MLATDHVCWIELPWSLRDKDNMLDQIFFLFIILKIKIYYKYMRKFNFYMRVNIKPNVLYIFKRPCLTGHPVYNHLLGS